MDALNSDLFEKKVLDPYLRFENAEEEAAYRKREQERKEEIDRLRAIGTPDALRQAAQLQLDQVQDAGDHGAKDSPDYPRLLSTAQANLQEIEGIQAQAASQSQTASKDAVSRQAAPTPNAVVPAEMDEIGAALAAAGVSVGSNAAPAPQSVPDVRAPNNPAAGLS
ncbi:hypothetical protein [Novosphingobium sp. CECT 9465]|uniref:hypothetical protein n=1 Tax=Novosphingobium sp. CECT 9465 TaxID=2829794 RepID=UPI001E56BA0F|nr:hypothetical protein [Novosphingobium sp. CECT 9465]